MFYVSQGKHEYECNFIFNYTKSNAISLSFCKIPYLMNHILKRYYVVGTK